MVLRYYDRLSVIYLTMHASLHHEPLKTQFIERISECDPKKNLHVKVQQDISLQLPPDRPDQLHGVFP